MASKIQLYSMATPNGQKIEVALEEMGPAYEPHTINILQNDTFTPEFIKLNPNSEIPVIMDSDGRTASPSPSSRATQSSSISRRNPGSSCPQTPVTDGRPFSGSCSRFGQFGHFLRSAKEKCKDPYPTERYGNKAKRLLGVLEKRLEGRDFVVDDGHSIADMALFPWIRSARGFYAGKLEYEKFPNVNAWVERWYARPASAKGTTVCFVPY